MEEINLKPQHLETRLSGSSLLEQRRAVGALPLVSAILSALPIPAALINSQRQILAANEALIEQVPYADLQNLIGLRPGEALGCVHASECPAGCGAAAACSVCGALTVILESQRRATKLSGEYRLTSIREGQRQSRDLRVTAAPLDLGTSFALTMISIHDISDEKRRRALERVFFHDIANTAGALNGILRILDGIESKREQISWLERAKKLAKHLVAEIEEQRDLVAAELSDLEVRIERVSANSILEEVAGSLNGGTASIEVDPQSAETFFFTDPTILRRVLINLLKNALEASVAGQTVRAGCTVELDTVTFWIANEGVMTPQVQLQIFQRSFSTRHKNRGLGTYSVKLLVERYLGGTVSFSSASDSGTVFSVQLPRSARGPSEQSPDE